MAARYVTAAVLRRMNCSVTVGVHFFTSAAGHQRRTSALLGMAPTNSQLLALGVALLLVATPAAAFFKLKQEEAATDSLHVVSPLAAGAALELVLHPSQVVGLKEGARQTVRILHRITNASDRAEVVLRFRSTRPDIVRVVGAPNVTLTAADNADWALVNASTGEGATRVRANLSELLNSSRAAAMELEGEFLGRAVILLEVRNGSDAAGAAVWRPLGARYKVSVIRRLRWIDRAFSAIVIGMVTVGNLGMGVQVKLSVVKEVYRRPLAPLIGFCCQYTVMPLIAFGVGSLLKLSPTVFLGYFAMGCAPGGGMSNFFTYLLGGDVSLSVTMTLISTLAALGMVPLWLFTLGRYILESQEHEIKIPFQNMMITLIAMLVPIAVGYCIKLKLPKVAKIIAKLTKPFLILIMLFFATVGIYANLYIFRLFSPALIMAACMLPYCGFFLGGLIAYIARLSFKYVKTVAIETGIQNAGVPILLLKFSLPQPDSYLSIIGPIAASMFTPWPLFIAIIVRELYLRCCKKPEEEKNEETKDREESEECGMTDGAKEMEVVRDQDKDQRPFLDRETNE